MKKMMACTLTISLLTAPPGFWPVWSYADSDDHHGGHGHDQDHGNDHDGDHGRGHAHDGDRQSDRHFAVWPDTYYYNGADDPLSDEETPPVFDPVLINGQTYYLNNGNYYIFNGFRYEEVTLAAVEPPASVEEPKPER